MSGSISLNPMLTTNMLGSFSVTSDGYTQGDARDDPATRFALATGIVASTETLPMWGGVGIFENVPGAAFPGAGSLGSSIGRATALTNLTGFSVFNQNHAWIQTAQGQVPVATVGMTSSFYRLGSGARIPVQVDPSLVSLEGGLVTQNVSWNFASQTLQPYDASTATYSITSMTWSATNGGQAVVVAGVATPVGAVGDIVNISGATNSGTGGAGLVNGNFTVTSFTDNEHFTIAMPGTSTTIGTIAGTIVANYGTGILPVKVLRLNVGNSKIVTYQNNLANWTSTGSCALILI